MKKRVFLYVRVSTLEQANEGYSIKEQEARLRAYAESKDYQVIKVYTDAGQTGANLNRPAMQEMIKNITSVDLVLVYKLDRLSRSQKDTLYLIEDVFLKNNVDFASLNESFDTSTPFGRAMIGILSVFAQLDREQIRERTIMGREARAKAGYYHGGGKEKVLTGYDYIDGELIINEYETECVKYIFDEYLKGKGVFSIFDDITVKFPNVVASAVTVNRILTTPTYTGVVQFNDKLFEGRHKAIISQETFDKAQELRKKRVAKSEPFKRSYLLSGLMHCGHCNARMIGKTGSKLKSGELAKYYVCYSRIGSPKHMVTTDNCESKYKRKELIEDKVIKFLKNIDVKSIESESSTNNNNDKIIALKKQIDKIDGQISKTVDLFSLGTISIDILTKKVDELNEDKEKILSHIEDLSNNKHINLNQIKESLSQLSDFDNLDDDTKRLLIANLVNKITVSDNDVTVDLSF